MFYKFCSTEGNVIINSDVISHVLDIRVHAQDSGTRAVYLKSGKMFEVSDELQDIHGVLADATKTNNNRR